MDDDAVSGHRPRVTGEVIIAHAVAVVDQHGMEALTLRRIAGDLGISTGTLHHHVGRRADIVRRVAESYGSRLEPVADQSDSWKSAVASWCAHLHAVLTSHPHLAMLLEDELAGRLKDGVGRLTERALCEGISRGDAIDRCWNAVTVTVNDALAQLRSPDRDQYATHGERRSCHPTLQYGTVVQLILEVSPIASMPTPQTVATVPRTPSRRARRAKSASALAWSLADYAKPVLDRHSRDSTYAQIGAGEYGGAIASLLNVLARQRRPLPERIAGELESWMRGYLGSERESELRRIIQRMVFVTEIPTP